MPMFDNFRSNLATLLDGQNKTEVARRAGIHRVTLYKLLRGEFDPTLGLCEELAKALGIKQPEKMFEKNIRVGR